LIAAGQESCTCPFPAVASRLAGAARPTSRLVDARRPPVPAAVPVTVSESAYGLAADVVFMRSVDVPAPVIDGGLKPPLLTPAGKPASLETERFTAPLNPLSERTVTVKVAD
jgi:hypothetical protein